jgi:Zn-dependent protease
MADERRQGDEPQRVPSVSLGRIAGIPVTLDWSLVLIFGLLTWLLATSVLPSFEDDVSPAVRWPVAAVTAGAFLASLLAHELSHSVMARRHGVGVRDIRLWLLGGISTLEDQPPSPRAELQIALVGPGASFVLAIGFGLAALALQAFGASDVVCGAAWYLSGVNALLAVFNLLPGAPLDGGRVVRAYLWKRRGDRRSAALSAARSGRTLGWVLVAVGLVEVVSLGAPGGVWLVLVGWFIASDAQAEELQTIATYGLKGVLVRDVMTPNPVCAPAGISVQDLLDDYVFTYRHSTFPLVDDAGAVGALVTLSRVKQVLPSHRATTRAIDVAWPLASVTTAAPGDAVLDVMGRLARGGDGRVLVLDAGAVVGIVSPSDISRVLQFADAHEPPQPVRGPA